MLFLVGIDGQGQEILLVFGQVKTTGEDRCVGADVEKSCWRDSSSRFTCSFRKLLVEVSFKGNSCCSCGISVFDGQFVIVFEIPLLLSGIKRGLLLTRWFICSKKRNKGLEQGVGALENKKSNDKQ